MGSKLDTFEANLFRIAPSSPDLFAGNPDRAIEKCINGDCPVARHDVDTVRTLGLPSAPPTFPVLAECVDVWYVLGDP